MDLWSILLVSLKRWYVVLAVMLVFLAPLLSADLDSFKEFQVEGAVLVRAPRVSQQESVPNPYRTSSATDLVVVHLLDESVRERFREEGLSDLYEFEFSHLSNVIHFVVRARTAETALATGEALVDEMRSSIEAKQDEFGIRDSQQVVVEVLRKPQLAIQRSGVRVPFAVAGLLGLTVGVIAAVSVDELLRRRRRSRSQAERREATAAPGSETPAIRGMRRGP